MQNALQIWFRKPLVRNILFWLGVYIFFTVSNSEFFASYPELFETYLAKVSIQCLAANVLLYLLIPRLLMKRKWLAFAVGFFSLMAVVNFLYTSVRMGYLEVEYIENYSDYLADHGSLTFWQRSLSPKAIFLKTPSFYLMPAFVLIAVQFYRRQQKLLKISEQKKVAELQALKNQLNPHFLFNTLNNLYALTLEKDDKAPLVIEKLSDILDHMLYGSNEKFVPLRQEVKLIEDYIVLEKIRFGDRLSLSFTQEIEEHVRIAPLLLLTFIENACKHGVSQELRTATIELELRADADKIEFEISNSKPITPSHPTDPSISQIGLQNVRQQLELLYPDKHHLDIKETPEIYSVHLRLESK